MQNDSSALVQIDPARTWERFVLVCVNWTQRECDMDQPASSELNLIPDFNLIPDPETGLALLAKCPAAETAEQALDRLFWHSQFTYWRNSLAGDRLAVAAAQMHCVLVKRLPPTWLCRAVHKLCMPDAEKRARADYVVDSSGSFADTEAQVDRILESLQDRPATALQEFWA